MGIQQAMIGALAGVVNLTAHSQFSTAGNAAQAFFNTDGSLQLIDDLGNVTLLDEWLKVNPNAAEAALYEVQRTQVSGTSGVSFTGTFTSGTWYPLTSQRGVSVVAGGVVRTNVSTYAIRRASDGVVLVTGVQIDLQSNP